MQSALVTGASGFIGSHLVEHLVESGYKVKAFVRYNSTHNQSNLRFISQEILSSVEIIYGDICDPDAVNNAMKDISLVFHLAAVISVPYSYEHPDETVSVNTVGTLNVLRMARQHNLERLVVTSTSEVYGTAVYTPMDEKHPKHAQSPYAASKISADALSESFFRAYGLPVTIVRPFNTFGPRQSARAIIPATIIQALTRAEVRLGSLEPTRDFLYVKDTVRGFLAAARSDKAIGEEINLGTGDTISIGDLAHSIINIIGEPIIVEVDQQRVRPSTSEVYKLQANIEKASRLLEWSPQVPRDTGLQLTIQWIKSHLDRFDTHKYYV